MAANIEVYTTDPCTFCLAAKNLLKKRGLEWTEHLVFGGTPEWDAMMARTGGKSVPQIVIDDEVIGGFPQLQAYDKEGKLSELNAADPHGAVEKILVGGHRLYREGRFRMNPRPPSSKPTPPTPLVRGV